jgi:hypothetical protein
MNFGPQHPASHGVLRYFSSYDAPEQMQLGFQDSATCSVYNVYADLSIHYPYRTFNNYSEEFGWSNSYETLVGNYNVCLVDNDLFLIGWAIDIAWSYKMDNVVTVIGTQDIVLGEVDR